ncbi:hypothetical protein ACEZCY_01640 [Streptacidiphilus sp. N1-12]|uniref:Uncharacterized protein n=2 Tax=Streptacidiphilus alkalitolerans TaxID=3342712 RepID=A0ABV6W7B2_9ACTN
MELDAADDIDLNNGDPRGLFAGYLDAVGQRREQPFTAFRAGEVVLPDGVLLPADPALPVSPEFPASGLPTGRHPVWIRVEPDAQGDPVVVLAVVPFGEQPALRWVADRGLDCPIRSDLLCLGPAAADPRARQHLLALARPEIARRGRRRPEAAGLPAVTPLPGAFRKGWQVLADPVTGADLVGLLTAARHGVQAIGRAADGTVAAYVLDLTG